MTRQTLGTGKDDNGERVREQTAAGRKLVRAMGIFSTSMVKLAGKQERPQSGKKERE